MTPSFSLFNITNITLTLSLTTAMLLMLITFVCYVSQLSYSLSVQSVTADVKGKHQSIFLQLSR